MKILMVCLGNICRSPLAQGIMEARIAKYDLAWSVDSCGTGAWHVGQSPDPRSIKTAAQNGLDITHQRARQFRAEDLDEFDLILTMDTQNYNDVLRFATDHNRDKVKMILNYLYPDQNRAVPDPYYEGGFDKVYEMLKEACNEVIKSHHSGN